MDAIKEKRPSQPFALWGGGVNVFKSFLETEETPVAHPAHVLLRAMQHREYEGGAILLLDNSVSAEAVGCVLHLDPTWLDLVRHLTDHNLVDERKEGQLKEELEEYGRELTLPLELQPVDQHM